MDVTDAIETRIDLRENADQPVADETKKAVLEAGRLAPSGRNLHCWRFILIDDRRELDPLGEASPTGEWVMRADFAVVDVTRPDYDFYEIDASRRSPTCSLSPRRMASGPAATPASRMLARRGFFRPSTNT